MSESPTTMLATSEASDALGIHPDSLVYARPELPRLALPRTSLYPATYIEALGASAYWTNRVEIGIAATAFAQTVTGRETAKAAETGFEQAIDTTLFALGNSALSRGQVAELLHVTPKSISTWKNQGILDESALLKGRRSNIPPHLLFELYRWERPRSHAEPADEASKPSDTLPQDHLLTRSETYNALGISASGFQKTEQHLHSLRLSTGAKRFPRHYLAALLDSETFNDTSSVTKDCKYFAISPAAARSIAAGETAMNALLVDAQPESTAPYINLKDLPSIFRVIDRTVRNWQSGDGPLSMVPKSHGRPDRSQVSATRLRRIYSWEYPAGYPQNPRMFS